MVECRVGSVQFGVAAPSYVTEGTLGEHDPQGIEQFDCLLATRTRAQHRAEHRGAIKMNDGGAGIDANRVKGLARTGPQDTVPPHVRHCTGQRRRKVGISEGGGHDRREVLVTLNVVAASERIVKGAGPN